MDRAAYERARRESPDPEYVEEWCKGKDPYLVFMTAEPGEGRWGAAPWQRAVVEDPSNRILIRGGNKIGKSLGLAMFLENWRRGHNGNHPRPEGPAKILYVVADMANAYADDVCRTLHEIIPSSELHEDTKYSTVRGYTTGGKRALLFANGDEIMFRSGSQDGQALAGLWSHLVLINEPPIQSRWGEIMRAAGLKKAPVVVGFTPVDNHGVSRDLLWLRDIVEGPPGQPVPTRPDGTPLWSQHVIRLCPENVPHRKPEEVLLQIADMPPWEVAQRRDAEWEGPSNERSLSAFGPENVFNASPGDWEALPGAPDPGELRLGLAADHGENANKEVIILHAWHGYGDSLTEWVLDAYLSPGQTSIEQDAEGVCQMLARWGLTPDHMDEAVGDTNSSGKGDWTARTVNEHFTKAFAALGYRLVMRPADKGAGSVGLGVRVLNDAFARKRLWICTVAAPIRNAAERWQGKNDGYKDKIDPLRYGPGAHFKAIWHTGTTRAGVRTPVVDTSWMGGGPIFTGEGGF